MVVGEECLAARVARLRRLDALRAALGDEGVTAAWLVGGAVRDLARGVEPARLDLDVALPGDGAAVARRLGRGLGGAAFPLDEAQGAWRVVLAGGDTVDLVPLRAPDLGGDLAGRDFTVNAVAFDLLGPDGIVDPLGGLGDLDAGVLRLCSPRALQDDPVRVLRAYRFGAGLGLGLAPELPAALARAAGGLRAAAPERVRTELFAVTGLPAGAATLRAMAAHGVLAALFPPVAAWAGLDQGDYHAHDLLEHALRTAEAAGRLAAEPADLPRPEALREHLAGELEAGVTRRALLVFCALFHDVAKPDTVTRDGERVRFLGHDVQGGRRVRAMLEALRVGRRARAAAERTVAAHLRLFQLAHQDPPTRRARLRYLKDLRAEVPEALLLSLADEIATGPAPAALPAALRTAAEVLELYWRRREAREIPPLLRGRDLLAELGLPEGPRVGEVLRRIEEAEREGRVSTREEALALARRCIGDDR